MHSVIAPVNLGIWKAFFHLVPTSSAVSWFLAHNAGTSLAATCHLLTALPFLPPLPLLLPRQNGSLTPAWSLATLMLILLNLALLGNLQLLLPSPLLVFLTSLPTLNVIPAAGCGGNTAITVPSTASATTSVVNHARISVTFNLKLLMTLTPTTALFAGT